jgi:transcription termination factor Rho
VAAQALEQSQLESKDKDQLLAIAKALGLKASSRNKKADIITQILEMTAAPATPASPAPSAPESSSAGPSDPAVTEPQPKARGTSSRGSAASSRSASAPDTLPLEVATTDTLPLEAEPPADWEREFEAAESEAQGSTGTAATSTSVDGSGSDRLGNGGRSGADPSRSRSGSARTDADRRGPRPERSDRSDRSDRTDRSDRGDRTDRPVGDRTDEESRNRRRRRRRKGGRGPDGPQGEDREILDTDTDYVAPTSNEPVPVEGYLDLRDEGYGFLRVKGFLPSREDAYIPVKLSRQYSLRKGDHITGLGRPAGRNEKNPALLEIHTINGGSPEAAKGRRRFEDLTALFPDERLRLENSGDPADMTARIIDLVSPIGKGQRGIIVSPPKAGKTTVMKTIATAIERNNPEVKMIVLLIDERPEEVTDMRRTVRGEVISSTFDRPSDEHTHVAEMTIERAKRMVEMGEDVVIILDGITRLSRAYNLAAPASGRILSGGIDAGALYPPKKFFGAARNIEEGGSLTILATALVETNSRMDDAIFEEFKGTGNMELRLDRRLAERRIYPAIDVDSSSTRHEELLFDRKQLQMVWKLRRVLSGLAADGNAAPGLELLIDRLKTFRTNDEFLNEIARQPTM